MDLKLFWNTGVLRITVLYIYIYINECSLSYFRILTVIKSLLSKILMSGSLFSRHEAKGLPRYTLMVSLNRYK